MTVQPPTSKPEKAAEARTPYVPAVRVVPLRYWSRIPLGIVVVAAVLWLLYSVVVNPNIDWNVVGQYFTSAVILKGVGVTIVLTVLSMVIGTVLGVIAEVMRRSHNRVLSGVAHGYIWLFRGTPVLVQLIFWYNLSLLFPVIGIGSLWSVETNTVITGFTAALLGLGLNQGAYMAEIVRAGIAAIDPGQTEAALAVGMTRTQALFSVVLPQALQVIIPPSGNEVINMLKTTALVSVISGADLLTTAQTISSRNFAVIEMLIVASIWYLILTTLFNGVQLLVERRLNGSDRTPRNTKGTDQ